MLKTFNIAIDDNELLRVNSQMNIDAFESLYNKYSPALYGIILKRLPDRQQAEEALKQTFLYVWYSAFEYNAEKERLFTWLHRKAQDQIDIVKENNKP